MNTWEQKIQKYCDEYNIPIYYLDEILKSSKVIPMIRGKAFEFSVLEKLTMILDSKIWTISTPSINAQSSIHDIDVLVIHKTKGTRISIECKLAKKGGCKVSDDLTEISIKCMRSRTLGTKMIQQRAPKLKISEELLTIHNDQYLPNDFDFVITSIGNAFYQTYEDKFTFSPNSRQQFFLKNFPNQDLKKETFKQFYIARSTDIAISSENNVICSRKDCPEKTSCGFIPNYPIIKFNSHSLIPINKWYPIEKAHDLFEEFCSQKSKRLC